MHWQSTVRKRFVYGQTRQGAMQFYCIGAEVLPFFCPFDKQEQSTNKAGKEAFIPAT